jgi:hypothetical protein
MEKTMVKFEVVPVRTLIDQFAAQHNAANKEGPQIRQAFYDPEKQAVILHVEVADEDPS